MAKIDLDDFKRQIQSLTASSATQEPNAEKLRVLSAQRRKEVKQIVGPALAQTGVDIAALREKLAKDERAFRDEFRRLQVPQAETIAARKTAFQKSVDLRRAAIEKSVVALRFPAPPLSSTCRSHTTSRRRAVRTFLKATRRSLQTIVG